MHRSLLRSFHQGFSAAEPVPTSNPERRQKDEKTPLAAVPVYGSRGPKAVRLVRHGLLPRPNDVARLVEQLRVRPPEEVPVVVRLLGADLVFWNAASRLWNVSRPRFGRGTAMLAIVTGQHADVLEKAGAPDFGQREEAAFLPLRSSLLTPLSC